MSAAGCTPREASRGSFDPATTAALRDFQQARGLYPTGECDQHTWEVLVESSWTLGTRSLRLTSPNTRGDDVLDLQTRLGRLGFDCGMVDGIFGPLADAALRAFQLECGLVADGVCGPKTVRALHVVGEMSGTGNGVTMLRDAALLRAGRAMNGARVAIGQLSTVGSLLGSLARELRPLGARALILDQQDAVAQARAANAYEADAYLGFEIGSESTTTVHFYRVETFESVGGRHLAELIAAQLGAIDVPCHVAGMRMPILRETKMPAAHVVLGPAERVLSRSSSIASAVTGALRLWISGRAS